MAALFSSPSPPKVQPVDTRAADEAAAEALRKRKQAKGYRATILSQMTTGTQAPQQTFGA